METLLNGDIEPSGFGAPALKLERIDGTFGAIADARFGRVLNHSFVIGAGGYGYMYYLELPENRQFVTEYGGLDLEYIILPRKSGAFYHFIPAWNRWIN